MTNTHILTKSFDYIEPATLDVAARLLEEYGSRASLMAGGTHLFTMIKMERSAPDVLINIGKIPELYGLTLDVDGTCAIGACTTIHELRRNAYIQCFYPALAQACASFGSLQIEIMGSIGGNVCNGSPASDTVPALMVYDAVLVLKSSRGQRLLPLEQFLLGPGRVALNPGEMLIAVRLPKPAETSISRFVKISRVSADLAKASLAIRIEREAGRVEECRIAMGAVAPVVLRLHAAEDWLLGKEITKGSALEAGEKASGAIAPIDDVRSTAWYRRQVARVMVYDTLLDLSKQSGLKVTELPELGNHPMKIKQGAGMRVNHAEKRQVYMQVNGKKQVVWVAPNDLLINVLREQLQLTGTKYGCGLGECSACTVHVDGKPALACLALVVALDGCSITTIEGLQSANGKLDPLQEAFIEHAAYQCGYCTPGMIMTLKGLLAEQAHASEDDIRDYLKGNRCRCTGYVSIVRAVESLTNAND